MNHMLHTVTAVCLLLISVNSGAADFVVREYLGHSWTHERVTFPLTAEQAVKVGQSKALLDSAGQEVVYQIVESAQQAAAQISFQTDLPPLESRAFHFSSGVASDHTDLNIQETEGELRISNHLIGLAIRKTLSDGHGPISGIRLRNGQWTGDSSLMDTPAVKSYSVEIMANGPVFVEVQCQLVFAGTGQWNLRFRIESGEPVVLVEESFDVPGGGIFQLSPGSENYRPTELLYRSGQGPNLGQVNSWTIGSGQAYMLEPWLHWWEAERQGNWFALYNSGQLPEFTNDMLMIGALSPSQWVEPEWSGLAHAVDPRVSARADRGQLALGFPLGGGSRTWMMGTPDRAGSIAALTEPGRKVAPLPQSYLIRHGDFPLDLVKDYILEWPGDHENYPRLFLGKQAVQARSTSLESDPQQLKRWENQQPIDKYNIDDPLREYFASGSAQLGDKIVRQVLQWLNGVVHEDFLLQNSRSTLGVAPHSQAVLLLPTINLSDAALGIDALPTDQRRLILAKLAFLAYTVNRDDYWSPERGFAANPNMTTTVAHYQVALAALIPSHPKAPEWAANGLATLYTQLMDWSDEQGGWLEAPHYAVVAYDHMLAAFIMATRAGFANYLYEDRMRSVAGWLARISTPRDVHTQGFRHLPPIGNTYFGESTGVFCILAGVWQDRDPEFARHMQWMCEEHGSPDLGLGWSFPSMSGYKNLLRAHDVMPDPPGYGSSWFQKTGVVLRDRMDSERETWLYLIAGSNHEHYDYDSGSILLWGKGRVLVDDWGYIGRHGPEFHNLLSSLATPGEMRITAFSTQPAFDFVSGMKGAWQRQIAFVKDDDPLGPSFFLIKDTQHFDLAADWRLWLTASESINAIQLHARGATVTGLDDVDFDLFFYRADQLGLQTETVEQKTSVGNRNGRTGPLTIKQTALIARLKNRGSVTVLIYPRLRSELSPTVNWHADGHIAEVISSGGTDYVLVATNANSDQPEEFSTTDQQLTFTGTAGLVRVRGQDVRMSLGASGSLRFDGQVFSSESAATENLLR